MGNGRPVNKVSSAIRIRMATIRTIVSPASAALVFLLPITPLQICHSAGARTSGTCFKPELIGESFHVLDRDNRRALTADDGFQSNSAQFVQFR
jgi:hypothetical protein